MLSSGKFLKSSMVDSKNTNTSHLMDGFHKDFSFSHDNYGYNTTENLYLEIDEGIVDNTGRNNIFYCVVEYLSELASLVITYEKRIYRDRSSASCVIYNISSTPQ